MSSRPGASPRELGNGDPSPVRLRNEGGSPGRRCDEGALPRERANHVRATPKRPGSEGLSLRRARDDDDDASPRRPRDGFESPRRPNDSGSVVTHRSGPTDDSKQHDSTVVPRDDESERPSSEGGEEEESNGGIVNVLTRFFSSGVKKILGHIREQGLSRPPLHPRPTPGDSPSSATSPPNDNDECRSGTSLSLGEVDSSYPRGSSPPTSGCSLSGTSAQPSSDPSSSGTHTYDWEIQAADVEICTRSDGTFWTLGRGGFGEVFKGLKDGVDEVAVKVIKLSHPEVVSQFKEEIELISKLRHRHIVQFYGACVQPSSLYMVTELMETDLFSALRLDQRYLWAGTHGRSVAAGVASGLHYLHSRKPPIVHRDVKSPNILLMGGVAKIADVGVARTKANMDMTAQKGFTAAWAAPEVVFRRRATEKIDVWSFGVVLWEIVTGGVPRPGQLVLPSWCSGALRHLYSSCTSEDPAARPSAGKIVQDLRLIQ